MPPGAELLDIAGVPVIDYPDWVRMGRFYAMPTDVAGDLRAVVESVRAEGRRRDRPDVTWWISPSTAAGVEDALVAAGAALDVRTEILALDMSAGPPDMTMSEGISWRVVTDAATLDDAETVAAAGWGGPPSSGARRAEQLRTLGNPLDDTGGFRVVAYRHGRAISTAGCQVVGEVARLYGGVTVEDARGLGGYRATLAARMSVAHEHGARLALIHARVETSLPIVQRIGFKSFGEARLYKLTTSSPEKTISR